MSADKSGIAVMASLSDFGLVEKDARGVFAEDTVLPRPLAAARDSIDKFSKRLGISPKGNSREVAAQIMAARQRAGEAPEPVSSAAAVNSAEPGI